MRKAGKIEAILKIGCFDHNVQQWMNRVENWIRDYIHSATRLKAYLYFPCIPLQVCKLPAFNLVVLIETYTRWHSCEWQTRDSNALTSYAFTQAPSRSSKFSLCVLSSLFNRAFTTSLHPGKVKTCVLELTKHVFRIGFLATWIQPIRFSSFRPFSKSVNYVVLAFFLD